MRKISQLNFLPTYRLTAALQRYERFHAEVATGESWDAAYEAAWEEFQKMPECAAMFRLPEQPKQWVPRPKPEPKREPVSLKALVAVDGKAELATVNAIDDEPVNEVPELEFRDGVIQERQPERVAGLDDAEDESGYSFDETSGEMTPEDTEMTPEEMLEEEFA